MLFTLIEKPEREIVVYQTEEGKVPFIDWISKLNLNIRERIESRIFRLIGGNYGDCKLLQEGVRELRCHFGSGYRVYFGETNNRIVILLCGGDKSTQDKDIKKALNYWKCYKEKRYG